VRLAIIEDVSGREDLGIVGRRVATRTRLDLGEELRRARLGAGLSQASVGDACAMSRSQVGRIERGELPRISLDQATRAALAVGLRLSIRAYPDGDPVRDAAQLALLDRLQRRLPPGTSWATEVPLPIPGDRRAWDALVVLKGRRAGCEAETRLSDIQALERRLALKLRDGGVDVLIVVVANTRSNRAVLEAHRADLRTLLPLSSREVMAAHSGLAAFRRRTGPSWCDGRGRCSPSERYDRPTLVPARLASTTGCGSHRVLADRARVTPHGLGRSPGEQARDTEPMTAHVDARRATG